jgi:hypothetical protein
MERMIARQRARIAFLKDGDANMAFFHLQCSHRRQKNKINSVVSEQRVLMEHADMAENAFSHFARHRCFPPRDARPRRANCSV